MKYGSSVICQFHARNCFRIYDKLTINMESGRSSKNEIRARVDPRSGIPRLNDLGGSRKDIKKPPGSGKPEYMIDLNKSQGSSPNGDNNRRGDTQRSGVSSRSDWNKTPRSYGTNSRLETYRTSRSGASVGTWTRVDTQVPVSFNSVRYEFS